MSAHITRLSVLLAACSFLALASPRPARPNDLTAEQVERIRQIKTLQQKRLMEEGLESRGDRIKRALKLRGERTASEARGAAGTRLIPGRAAGQRETAARVAAGRVTPAAIGRAPAARAGSRAKSATAGARQRPALRREREEATRGLPAKRLRTAGIVGVQSFARNVRVSNPALDDPTQADAQSETSIGVWGSYVLAAWNDGQGRRSGGSLIGYGYSTDGGQTFTDAGEPPEPALPTAMWTSDPVIAVNEKTGDFYFCALVDPLTETLDLHGVGVVRGTFSGSTFVWDTPRTVKYLSESAGFIDKPWIAADSVSGNIYLSYTRFTGTRDSIIFLRSTNNGLSWGPQITLSSDAATGRVQGSRPVVGPDGEVYVVWKEIGVTESGEDYMRIRKSTDRGVTFGPEYAVASLFDNFGTGAPQFNREIGITYPSIAVDRSDGPRRGHVYVAWNEALNYYDSLPGTANPLNEVEPNDTTFTAQAFTPGQTLIGSFLGDEFDYYRFNAVQGTTYLFWADHVTVRYTIRLFCADGVTRLSFSGDRFGYADGNGYYGEGFIVWTAPTTGTYYLRMTTYEGLSGSYRVRTATDVVLSAQRARDHRDIFVASSPDGATWGTPVLVNDDSPYFDNWLPEVAVTATGTVYATWYNWSDSPTETCGGLSHTYVARSDNGGATWLSLGAVSDYMTAWTYVNSNIIPNQGDYIALFANNVAVYPCWTDGRLTTPDVMAAPFLLNGLQIAIETVVADTGHVAITWRATGVSSVTAKVYRRQGTQAYELLGTITSDIDGRLLFDDPNVEPGQQYQYRLGIMVNNVEVFLGERTVQVPLPLPPALELAVANPVRFRDGLRVSLSLPTGERALLTLFDLTGRRVREWNVSADGAGQQVLDFGHDLELEAGFYMLRLTQGEAKQVRRVVILP